MKPKRKKLWITLICVVLVLAIGGGCGWYFLGRGSAEPVPVFMFNYVGMTEYWGDNLESYGPVTTDRIQTVFLSSTQTVTEVFVKDGDTVKKGDLLMTFDTTLSDIAIERERLKVEKLKLDLDDAYKQLRDIKNMKPMVIPEPKPEEEENLGVALTEAYRISPNSEFDGSSKELALICWLREDTQMEDALFAALLDASTRYRVKETPTEPTEPTEETEPVTEPDLAEEPTEAPTEAPTEPTEPPQSAADPNRFFVVFKTTNGNMSLGATQLWQGMEVTFHPETAAYSFRFYDASGFKDHTLAKEEAEEPTEPDIGSGYTAQEIAQMRAQQEKVIRDLEFEVKVAEADYKIKQTEISDGNVYAKIDGTVIADITEEEAKLNGQPFMKVSGGGGFYVEGSVSELDRANLQIGQEVTINDWNTGMTYTGEVSSIEDYPLSGDYYYSGVGNPNSSYYPFTVFIDGTADLQEGSYVSVMYSVAAAQTGVYLENPFLRTENGKSYVYVRGEDGLLEKRFVTTGKSLWGSYTQIVEGLTAEDFVAFPYGKTAKEGAPTVESDLSVLYE